MTAKVFRALYANLRYKLKKMKNSYSIIMEEVKQKLVEAATWIRNNPWKTAGIVIIVAAGITITISPASVPAAIAYLVEVACGATIWCVACKIAGIVIDGMAAQPSKSKL
ncbi:hypothetical protein F5884DRAFT_806410 [Xylogone sp. PMI_703]|nr:hypothetical protein F5884DRAFT_806410 [Xylogone sp. PMI_703]